MYRSPFDDQAFDPSEIAGAFTEEEIRQYPNVTTFLGGHINGRGEKVPSGAVKVLLDGSSLNIQLTFPDTTYISYVPLSGLSTLWDELEHAFEHDHVRWRNWEAKGPGKKGSK